MNNPTTPTLRERYLEWMSEKCKDGGTTMEEQVTWFISQFSAEIDGMMANKEAVGDAPGDNAVGSEQRAFGRNSALSELKKKLTDKT